jgi:hypothetical protein
MGFDRPADRVNPADYAMEICNARLGTDKFDTMARVMQNRMIESIAFQRQVNEVSAESLKKSMATSKTFQFQMLFKRCLQSVTTKSPQLFIRMLLSMLMAISLCFMFDRPIGEADGCWTQGLLNPNSNSKDEVEQLLDTIRNGTTDFRMDFVKRSSRLTTNATYMFLQMMFVMVVQLIGTALIMPLEIEIVSKEMANSWYHPSAYFLSRVMIDTISILTANSLSHVYIYWFTGQIREWWRFFAYYAVAMLFGFVCDAIGLIVGIIFSYDNITAISMATMVTFPIAALSGLMVRFNDIPAYLRYFAYLSPLKYSFEGALLSVYGFGRCVGGEKVRELFASILTGSNPMLLSKTVFQKLNVTLDTMRSLSLYVGLHDNYMDPVYYKMKSKMGGADDQRMVATAVKQLAAAEKSYQPSFILSFFDMYEDVFAQCFVGLIIMAVAYRILGYYCLKRNIRNRRL